MGLMEELNERINLKAPALAHKAIQPTFGWDTAAGYLTHCSDNDVGEPVGILHYRLPMADQLDSVKPVVEYLTDNIDTTIVGSDMYLSFTTKPDLKYTSNNDVLLWNVFGESTLRIINGETREVGSGDLMYIPANTEYMFKPSTARICIVFSLSKEE